MSEREPLPDHSARGDRIARMLVTATPEETIALLCEALDWAHVYLPSRAEADRHAEEWRSVIGRLFPQFSNSPILTREAALAITEAARTGPVKESEPVVRLSRPAAVFLHATVRHMNQVKILPEESSAALATSTWLEEIEAATSAALSESVEWVTCPACRGHGEPQGDGSGWDGTTMHTPACDRCDGMCAVPADTLTSDEDSAKEDR